MAERVCCLYRVSTDKQVDYTEDHQADIPMQRKECRTFAERMGWTIVMEKQEAGVSGFKVSANDRDVLQDIKERAEKSGCGVSCPGKGICRKPGHDHGRFYYRCL